MFLLRITHISKRVCRPILALDLNAAWKTHLASICPTRARHAGSDLGAGV